MFYLMFNNKRNTDLGIKIVKRPNIPVAAREKNTISIPGRGQYISYTGGYDDIEIAVQFNLIERKFGLKEVFRYVKAWLYNIKDNKLTFSDDADYYYKVKDVTIDDFEIALRRKGAFTVKFTCYPFTYLHEGDIQREIANNTVLFNQFGIDAKPLIYLEADGEVTISINNSTFKINVDGYAYIDSDLELAYKDKTDLFNLMQGDYPILTDGENTINYSSNVTKFEIEPRWRCL